MLMKYSNVRVFEKNVKTCLQNKKTHLVKLPQQHANTSLFSFVISKWRRLYRKSLCFLCYSFQYDEVYLMDLLDGCYHYLVFMDTVNGYWKSKLPNLQSTFWCSACSVKLTKPFVSRTTLHSLNPPIYKWRVMESSKYWVIGGRGWKKFNINGWVRHNVGGGGGGVY